MDENNLQPNAADAKTPEQPEDLLHHLECDLNEPRNGDPLGKPHLEAVKKDGV